MLFIHWALWDSSRVPTKQRPASGEPKSSRGRRPEYRGQTLTEGRLCARDHTGALSAIILTAACPSKCHNPTSAAEDTEAMEAYYAQDDDISKWQRARAVHAQIGLAPSICSLYYKLISNKYQVEQIKYETNILILDSSICLALSGPATWGELFHFSIFLNLLLLKDCQLPLGDDKSRKSSSWDIKLCSHL